MSCVWLRPNEKSIPQQFANLRQVFGDEILVGETCVLQLTYGLRSGRPLAEFLDEF
jgi:hypothetical protein